jgi:hypothetical protein
MGSTSLWQKSNKQKDTKKEKKEKRPVWRFSLCLSKSLNVDSVTSNHQPPVL